MKWIGIAAAVSWVVVCSAGCTSKSSGSETVAGEDTTVDKDSEAPDDGSPSGEPFEVPACDESFAEICDGFDNDCDGLTDDKLSLACGPCLDGAPGCHTAVIRGGGWDEGIHRNTVTGSDKGVFLPPPPARSDYVWIANSPDDSVSKVRVSDGVEVARFQVGDNPSRTAVDGNGDCWVAMRGKLGDTNKVPTETQPFENVIKIDGDCEPTIKPPIATRECIVFDLPEVGNLLRGLAIDARGDAWVGAHGSQEIVHIDGELGIELTRFDVPNTHPYGMAVDELGYVWVASRLGSETVLRIDPTDESIVAFETIADQNIWPYGIAADGNGRMWFAAETKNIFSIDTETLEYRDVWTVGQATRGITVDDDGMIWTADSFQDLAIRVDPDSGEILAEVMVPSEPVGVAVDHDGFLWAVSELGETATKIDMSGRIVNTVEGLQNPYTYSDMTGSAFRVFRVLRGLFKANYDSGYPDANWTEVDWIGAWPASSEIELRLRAGDALPLEGGWTTAALGDAPAELDLVGQYLEVEVVLVATERSEVPNIEQLLFVWEEN